jgi:peptidoglycan/xylan/chitin deacetylase (PgdA/CDA1 family)
MNIAYRIKRKWHDLTILRQPVGEGPAGKDKISLVLYVDYEGKYGKTDYPNLNESGFFGMLNAFREHEVKATWNCVGLFAEHHAETIKQIISEGHEVASHTYRHIVPLTSKKNELEEDIHQFKKVFEDRFNLQIRGFHSPKDAWSKCLIKILADCNFSYDIAVETNPQHQHAAYLSTYLCYLLKKEPRILRIPSVCDDWMFVSKSLTPLETLKHWESFLTDRYKGKVIAIGFHPWVIEENNDRKKVFDIFLSTARNSEIIEIYTGREIANWYRPQA